VKIHASKKYRHPIMSNSAGSTDFFILFFYFVGCALPCDLHSILLLFAAVELNLMQSSSCQHNTPEFNPLFFPSHLLPPNKAVCTPKKSSV
jgi:hypothetical protein